MGVRVPPPLPSTSSSRRSTSVGLSDADLFGRKWRACGRKEKQGDDGSQRGMCNPRRCPGTTSTAFWPSRELAYHLGSNPRACGFDSHLGHHLQSSGGGRFLGQLREAWRHLRRSREQEATRRDDPVQGHPKVSRRPTAVAVRSSKFLQDLDDVRRRTAVRPPRCPQVAQLVEQKTEDLRVGGSIPSLGAIKFHCGRLA